MLKHIIGTNNKGFSLTEILVTIGILSIVAGIGTMQYRKYDLRVEKQNLRQAGRYFALAVGNCIGAQGGWKIERPDVSNGNLDFSKPPVEVYPCKPDGVSETPVEITQGSSLETELKKKLDFECPKPLDKPETVTCNIMSRSITEGNTNWRYYCLDIRKTVQGKKLQVFSRVSFDDPSNYEVLCKETQTFTDLVNHYCRKKGVALKTPGQGPGKDPRGASFKDCKWPKE